MRMVFLLVAALAAAAFGLYASASGARPSLAAQSARADDAAPTVRCGGRSVPENMIAAACPKAARKARAS